MSKTVVGIFEYESDAQDAQNYLLANGFGDGDVDIKTASYKSETGETVTNKDDDRDMGDRISSFFSNLFDGDDDEVNRYSEAGRRGTIVTVHASTAEEAETAAAILDNYGAVDVNGTTSGLAGTGGMAGINDASYADDVSGTIDYARPSDLSSASGLSSTSDLSTTSDYATSDLSSTRDLSDASGLPDTSGLSTESYATAASYEDPILNPPSVNENNSDSLSVIEEELHVGKREVETGGVRLRSRIIERPVQESIRLRQERVTIDRTPVDRAATGSEFDTFKEGTIEMKEYAEIPVVSKEARVVEEVRLNKTVDEREEVINDTVRHTEVDVEDLTDEERLRRSGLDL